MEEQLITYLISLFFFFSCYKGYKNGASYEAASIIFSSLAIITGLTIYSDSLIRKCLSIIIFLTIYFLGLFISFLVKRKTLIEKISGVLLGGLKYLTYLVFTNILIMITESNLLTYDENIYIRKIKPISLYLKDQITTYFLPNNKIEEK